MIHKTQCEQLSRRPRVRFQGPDGGWRLGIHVGDDSEGGWIFVLDPLRQEVFTLTDYDHYEYQPERRDDQGNPQ